MSCRSGATQNRGATSGPQPLRATVPFQLHNTPQTSLRNGKPEKTKTQQMVPGMRRTMSLDAIVCPYLQGHWPKEVEVQASLCRKDQSTQTPDPLSHKAPSKSGSEGHRRSASWGSDEHLQETQPVSIPLTPLYKLTPPLHQSVEGLNQELEGMFVCQLPHHQQRILEVPDGHRAPVPLQRCKWGSQSDRSSMPPSSTPSPSYSLSPSMSPPGEDLAINPNQDLAEDAEQCLLTTVNSSQGGCEPFPLLLSSSPWPNKTYCFQREPPEGCEKVRVCEDTSIPCPAKSSLLYSCPDLNKVNFTPHGGSAFCPVSLLKPLLPSMDLLFRSLAVSPATGCFSQGTAPHHSPSPALPDSVTTAM